MLPRQLTPFAVHDTVADSADFGPAAARALARWPDNAGSLDDSANAGPLLDTTHCNTALADAAAKTAVRIP